MKRFLYELSESWKIAVAQMRSNMTRSTLTALGVIIGIVAVTLMGTAISGIQVGFDKSMSIFGDDVLYVGQWPWKQVDDWWNYRDRKKIKTEYADALNRMIAQTPNSNLIIAIPTSSVSRSVKYEGSEVNNVFVRGTVSDYIITSTFDFKEGRFFNELESRGGSQVCVIGYDVADALFPSSSPIDKTVQMNGQPFKVIGVISRQGSFLGLFSLDSIVVMPLPAFQKYFTSKSEAEILVKVKDKTKLTEAKDELGGLMRRVRGLPPEKEGRLQHQRTTGVEEHAGSDQELNRHRGTFHHWSFAFRRGNRDHEHHLREREGTDERNRHTQSARGASTDDLASILDRIDRALSTRRIDRANRRISDVLVNRRRVSVVPCSFFDGPSHHEHDRFGPDRFGFRLCPGLVGLAPRSGNGTQV